MFGDWSYTVKMDYGSGGGTGIENPGKIQQAYIEYDGLKPFLIRIGNHSAATGLDEAISGADLLLLERAAPSDLARGMASSGRNAIEFVYEGDRLSASLAYTDGKIQSGGFFDEQQALVARMAYSPVATQDWRWVVSLAGNDVFRPGDQGPASNSARPFSLSVLPELVIDDSGSGFVSVSEANVTDAWSWNLESAVRRDNVMVQAGYYKFGIDRRGVAALRGEGFDGWYAEGSWVLSGEARGWSISNAGFTNPKPGADFDPGRDAWGAWELAGRYQRPQPQRPCRNRGRPAAAGWRQGRGTAHRRHRAQLVSQHRAEIHAAGPECADQPDRHQQRRHPQCRQCRSKPEFRHHRASVPDRFLTRAELRPARPCAQSGSRKSAKRLPRRCR